MSGVSKIPDAHGTQQLERPVKPGFSGLPRTAVQAVHCRLQVWPFTSTQPIPCKQILILQIFCTNPQL